jgi:hypothetical protein
MQSIIKTSVVLTLMSFALVVLGAFILYVRHLDQQSLQVNLPPHPWRAELAAAEDLSSLRSICSRLADAHDRATQYGEGQVARFTRIIELSAAFLILWGAMTAYASFLIARRAWSLTREGSEVDRDR